jgi:hypothetical protein
MTKPMENNMSENINNEASIWAAISELKQDNSVVKTDIRGIYAGMDEIRDVLVRMQENAKPNIGGMFLVLLATCTFMVTVGGLTLAPLYRGMTGVTTHQVKQDEILMERTGILGRMEAQNLFFQQQLDDNKEDSKERHGYQDQHMADMQAQINFLRSMSLNAQNRASKLEGQLAPNWNELMEKEK